MRCYSTRLDALRNTPIEIGAPLSVEQPPPLSALPLRVTRRVKRDCVRVWKSLSEETTQPLDPPLTHSTDMAQVRASIVLQPATHLETPREKLRVVHVIGSLAAGGAERQLAYVARETQRRGKIEARILTTHPTVGAAAHYLPIAQEAAVTVEMAGASASEESLAAFESATTLHALLAPLPEVYRAWVVELAGEFIRLKPDVVHAWLDHTNMWAGIAALAVGVPQVILSTRNVNPSHFPTIDSPEFLPWYRAFAQSPRVQFVGNSTVGARDYAAWIGIEPSRFTVIVNGFDPSVCVAPDSASLRALREDLGLVGKRVILGVFRLAEEKQPLTFIDAAERILRLHPDAIVLLAGEGPMRAELEARLAGWNEGRLRLLGRREDVGALLSLADLLLHTSRQEGSPNALIEAQSLGCPVVATRGGGTVDAVEDGGSGYLCAVGDAASLASRASALLKDEDRRRKMSSRAREFAQEKFGLTRMVDETLALYARRASQAS